jgi:hypothetical protein
MSDVMVPHVPVEGVRVKGSLRLRIRNKDGSIHGDTGFLNNQVVNLGFNDYLVRTLGGITGSKVITHLALGSGTQPAAAGTSLQGEVVKRKAITAATSSTSKALRLTATFGSTDSFVTNTQNIRNAGLFNTSAAGTLFAGNTFNSSSCATNQQVEVTYDVSFS